MEAEVVESTPEVIFTDSAAGKVRELLDEESNPGAEAAGVRLPAAAAPVSNTVSPSTRTARKATCGWRMAG